MLYYRTHSMSSHLGTFLVITCCKWCHKWTSLLSQARPPSVCFSMVRHMIDLHSSGKRNLYVLSLRPINKAGWLKLVDRVGPLLSVTNHFGQGLITIIMRMHFSIFNLDSECVVQQFSSDVSFSERLTQEVKGLARVLLYLETWTRGLSRCELRSWIYGL